MQYTPYRVMTLLILRLCWDPYWTIVNEGPFAYLLTASQILFHIDLTVETGPPTLFCSCTTTCSSQEEGKI